MEIEDLLWDDWNEDHVRRHGIEPAEVEEAVFDPSAQFFRTRAGRVSRYIVLGLTDAGRYVFVVVEPAGRKLAYVVTAREMTDREKRRFKRR